MLREKKEYSTMEASLSAILLLLRLTKLQEYSISETISFLLNFTVLKTIFKKNVDIFAVFGVVNAEECL